MSRPNYHHGNLRNELVELATTELELKGESGISLRELAARLGVARSAPYRHFATRDELLVAVAQNAIVTIRSRFLAAYDSPASPREQLRQACRSYLEFAHSRPELYRLIFDPDVARLLDVRLQEQEQDSSLGIFSKIIARTYGLKSSAKLHDYVVLSWAVMHGYALLRMNAGINVSGFIESVEELVLAVTSNMDRLSEADYSVTDAPHMSSDQ
jgi:AcrR family transcriptional regulator